MAMGKNIRDSELSIEDHIDAILNRLSQNQKFMRKLLHWWK